MADPKTREELVKEIENTVSENENYKGFKDALAELNQNIDELMKPGKEGWKLLDEAAFAPLYDNYLKTAKKLSAFLRETRESTDPEEKKLREICNAFRRYFANDVDVMRKYRTELQKNPKSLPTLFEESKVNTVILYDKNVDVRGGANSARMAMKVMKKNGQETEGFFTKAVYYDPMKLVQDALDRSAAVAKKPEEIALLKKFTDVYRAYCQVKEIPKEKEAENLVKILDAVGTVVNGRPFIAPSKFFKVYSQMIREVRADKAASILGLSVTKTPIDEVDMEFAFGRNTLGVMSKELGMAWNTTGNERAADIAPNSRLDTRNVAMSNVARLLGMKDIICGARMMKLKNQNGQETEGIFMEKARGVDPNNPGPDHDLVDSSYLTYGDCHCLKQLADLQVLDYICGNIDRHGGNIFFEFGKDGALVGIQGIDNDLSFGGLKNTEGNVAFLMTPQHMGAISKATADKILSLDPEVFSYSLYGILDKHEVEAAELRLANMQKAIKISRRKVAEYKQKNPHMDDNTIKISYGALREIEDGDWKKVNMKQLFSMKHGAKNIFVEAKETLDDFGALAKAPVREVSYISAGTVNRAMDTGIISRMQKTEELVTILAAPAASPSAPASCLEVVEELHKHKELLSKIVNRMQDCKKKVKKGTAETGEYFGQYVTKDDLEKIRKSEENIREAVKKYSVDRVVDLGEEDKLRRTPTVRREIDAMTEVHAFVKNTQNKTPEEEETLKANHRKAVEEITRAIIANPDSAAAGPKTPRDQARRAGARKPAPKKAVMTA